MIVDRPAGFEFCFEPFVNVLRFHSPRYDEKNLFEGTEKSALFEKRMLETVGPELARLHNGSEVIKHCLVSGEIGYVLCQARNLLLRV